MESFLGEPPLDYAVEVEPMGTTYWKRRPSILSRLDKRDYVRDPVAPWTAKHSDHWKLGKHGDEK